MIKVDVDSWGIFSIGLTDTERTMFETLRTKFDMSEYIAMRSVIMQGMIFLLSHPNKKE